MTRCTFAEMLYFFTIEMVMVSCVVLWNDPMDNIATFTADWSGTITPTQQNTASCPDEVDGPCWSICNNNYIYHDVISTILYENITLTFDISPISMLVTTEKCIFSYTTDGDTNSWSTFYEILGGSAEAVPTLGHTETLPVITENNIAVSIRIQAVDSGSDCCYLSNVKLEATAIVPSNDFVISNSFTEKTHSTAISDCQSTYGTHLAMVTSFELNEKAVAICNAFCVGKGFTLSNCGCWIGVYRNANEDTWQWQDGTLATQFGFNADGTANGDVAPWYATEPSNGLNEAATVRIGDISSTGVWADAPSGRTYYPMCNAPTPSPTAAPIGPTISPTTKSPSSAPTNDPSSAPSNIPSHPSSSVTSVAPTRVPTLAPIATNSPTKVPSNVPSQTPSGVPSQRPSDSPSDSPSHETSEVLSTSDPDSTPIGSTVSGQDLNDSDREKSIIESVDDMMLLLGGLTFLLIICIFCMGCFYFVSGKKFAKLQELEETHMTDTVQLASTSSAGSPQINGPGYAANTQVTQQISVASDSSVYGNGVEMNIGDNKAVNMDNNNNMLMNQMGMHHNGVMSMPNMMNSMAMNNMNMSQMNPMSMNMNDMNPMDMNMYAMNMNMNMMQQNFDINQNMPQLYMNQMNTDQVVGGGEPGSAMHSNMPRLPPVPAAPNDANIPNIPNSPINNNMPSLPPVPAMPGDVDGDKYNYNEDYGGDYNEEYDD